MLERKNVVFGFCDSFLRARLPRHYNTHALASNRTNMTKRIQLNSTHTLELCLGLIIKCDDMGWSNTAIHSIVVCGVEAKRPTQRRLCLVVEHLELVVEEETAHFTRCICWVPSRGASNHSSIFPSQL